MEELLIPKIFHRIWVGNKMMPKEFVEYGETWLKHHPDWEMKLWTDENMINLKNQKAYDNASQLAQKADIARYEILYQFGGVYIDCDFECVKNIEPLLKGINAFAASEDDYHISIGIMGAIPESRFFKLLVDNIERWMDFKRAEAICVQTGPGFATALLRNDKDFKVFEKEKFYPYYFTEKYRKGEFFEGAYAIHHWAASWWK